MQNLNLDLAKVAAAITCPAANVATNWPAIETCLTSLGIYTRGAAIAALATTAVETNYTFQPIRELDNRAHTYLRAKPYWPFFGRGYIQLTWEKQYREYGQALGIDLVSNPDKALEPDVAASVLAKFFLDHHIATVADRSDWTTVRKIINGGTNGLPAFLLRVKRLEVLAQ